MEFVLGAGFVVLLLMYLGVKGRLSALEAEVLDLLSQDKSHFGWWQSANSIAFGLKSWREVLVERRAPSVITLTAAGKRAWLLPTPEGADGKPAPIPTNTPVAVAHSLEKLRFLQANLLGALRSGKRRVEVVGTDGERLDAITAEETDDHWKRASELHALLMRTTLVQACRVMSDDQLSIFAEGLFGVAPRIRTSQPKGYQATVPAVEGRSIFMGLGETETKAVTDLILSLARVNESRLDDIG